MNRFSPWFGAFCALALVSCDTFDTPVLEPGEQVPAILDSRDPGLAGSGVFLLPPISDNRYTRTAPFDVNGDPRVELCRLDVTGDMTVENIEAAPCAELVAWFETDVSHDGVAFVTVTPGPGEPASADSMFSVNWNTDAEDAGSAFRGSILLPRLVLDDGGAPTVQYETAARFDALLYSNSSEQLDPYHVVGTTAGQNFPVKFIMEQSQGCSGLDCFAYRVTCEAAVYQTEHAGVSLPEDWASECDVTMPGPERSWWLFQERLPAGSPCIPGGLIDGFQFEPCYVWQLAEEVDVGDASAFQLYNEEFADPATIQFCYNQEADGGVPASLIPLTGVYRYSVPPGEVALTPESDENALTEFTCSYDGLGGGQGAGPLAALTDFVRPALQLFGVEPRPLFAGDAGTLSTKTIRMSYFQHVVVVSLDVADGAFGPLLVGQSQDITVQLTTPPHGEPLDGPEAGVPDVEVQYRVLEGDADLSGGDPCTDVSGAVIDDCVVVLTSVDDPGTSQDEGGQATASLTIGGTGGTVVIQISVPGDPDAEPLILSVEAVDLEVVFLEPLDAGDFYGAPDERFEPTVYICEESALPCDTGSAEAVIPTSAIKLVEENGGRKFYQAYWKPRDTDTGVGGTYVAQVVVGDATVGSSIPIVATKGGKGERIDDVYYNGINSSLALKFTITPGGG